MRVYALLISILFVFSKGLSQEDEAKVDALMQLMTLQEKIGQTVMFGGSWDQTEPIVGNYDGNEIQQLYIRDKVGSIKRPIKELKGFQKVFLKKGKRKIVSFTIY